MIEKKYILDGSPEVQKQIEEEFLASLAPEERERSLSSEFDYLDEE